MKPPPEPPKISEDGEFYWDGKKWRPIPPEGSATAAGPSAWTIARGVALGILAVLAVLYILNSCSEQQAQDDYRDCLIEFELGDPPCVEP